MEPETQRAVLLGYLGRGGKWQYTWTIPGQESAWFPAGKLASAPKSDKNIYFGVHPVNTIPEKNARGEKASPKYVRSQNEHISAVNCLFAEFDTNKGATFEKVEQLQPRPTVVIESGGGWHCYWILQDPFLINSPEALKRAQQLQYGWVDYTGGDDAAKDLARILRLPGTFNHKYSPARPVRFVWADFSQLNDLAELEKYLPDPDIKRAVMKTITGPELIEYNKNPDPVGFWLGKYLAQAIPGQNRNHVGKLLALQLRDNGVSMAEALGAPYPEKVSQADHPYTRREWEATVKNIYGRPPREPARAITGASGQDDHYMPPEPPEAFPDDLSAFEPIINNFDEPTISEPPEFTEDARFTVHTAEEALQPQAPIEWRVENLAQAGDLIGLVGSYGVGKTYIVVDLAVCVAAGKKFLDFSTTPCKALIIDEESGARRLGRRLGEVLRGEKCGKETPVEFVSLAGFNLQKAGEAALLHALIEERGAGLVIIDALADVMAGADENSVKDTQPVLMHLKRIAEKTKATIIFLHHLNKMGGYRGSTAIPGAVDLMLKVKKQPGGILEFGTEKARDIEPVSFAGVLRFEPGQVWMTPIEYGPAEQKLGKAQKYVLRFLADNGASTVSEIMDHADTCAPGGARLAVYNLAELGLTKRVDEGGPGEKASYDLTDEGRKHLE